MTGVSGPSARFRLEPVWEGRAAWIRYPVRVSSAVNAAWATLQGTGRVSLPGEPAVWSGAMRWLFLVLLTLIGVLAVGGLVAVPFALASGIDVTVATVLGFLGVYAMLTVAAVLLNRGYRRQKRYLTVERRAVVLDAHGITLRGVGPIPWRDFGLAQHLMVRNEHSDGWVRRAVMPLTASGFAVVNQRLAPALRERISPPTGPFWNRTHRHIYVPGVEEMGQGEVMWLINAAHQMFSGDAHRPAPGAS